MASVHACITAPPLLLAMAAAPARATGEAVGPPEPKVWETATPTSMTDAKSNIVSPGKCLDGKPRLRGIPLNSFSTELFSLEYPCGWSQVQNLNPEYGVLASFYNPAQPGVETAAVFVAPSEARSTKDLGSPQQVGQALADVAPFGELKGAKSFQSGGRLYYIVVVQFGGTTAGMFGAVYEYRCITVVEGTMYFFRVTTARLRWLEFADVRATVEAVAGSFRVKL